MSTVVMAVLGGWPASGPFLVFAGLSGRQVFAAGRVGRVGGWLDSSPRLGPPPPWLAGAAVLADRLAVGASLRRRRSSPGPACWAAKRPRGGDRPHRGDRVVDRDGPRLDRRRLRAGGGHHRHRPVAPAPIAPEVAALVRRLEHQRLPDALAAFGDDVATPPPTWSSPPS